MLVQLFMVENVLAQCTHTIALTDTYGDGWNGGAVSVSVNGTVVLNNITLGAGFGPANYNFTASAGQTIRVYTTIAGSWASERRIRVVNNTGVQVIALVGVANGTATSGGRVGTAVCAAAPPPCASNNVNLNITGGTYPGEVSWNLVNPSGATVASGGAPYNQNLCLPTGCYTFNMIDSYGDGWNGANYTFTLGGSSIGTGTLASGASGSAQIGIGTSCAPPAAPANDLVCSATAITCGATLSGTTVNATNSGTGEGGSCGTAQTQPGVWYVVAGNGQTMTASLCATAWDSKISVYSGTNCSTLTCVGGNDDGGPACTGTSASYSWPSVVGQNYYILVHGFGSTSAFSINLSCVTPITPPANDLVCSATAITCGATLSGTTVNATNSGTGEGGSCGTAQTQPGVWYVVAGNGQTMTASLCATAWDSKISVYSGTNCSTLTCVGGNDDGGPACTGSSASYSWPSVSGTNYYILVHGYSSTSAFSINLSCVTPTPPPANDNCANAQSIAIQCPAAATAVSGTTANATEEAMADPSCDPGTIRDVWYTFNSGNNSSVDLSVTLGTASWLGGEIHTTCGTPAPGLTIGGNPGNCDFYLLNPAPTNISGLTPNTDYRLRLFTNVDWDIAGTFTFTLTNTGNSTAPAITLMPGTYCPNTDITLSAAGGTSGAGAVINWYSGANGTGTLLGTGGSVVVAPTATTTYYVRREGLCNNSADDAITINAKNFMYAANGTSASNYCTDNNGWNHFYNGDDIIFSVEGDLSGAPLGYPIATINNNSAFYQETEGPGTAPGCVNNENPNEERFEMSRSWNLDFGGGTQNGTYKIRFYYPPAEKTAIENAANAWMANYVFCSYDYKYPSEPFYWFKNTASNYTAPDYDGDHYSATVSSTNSGINYSEWNNITSFSGGSGAIIVLPTNTPLPVELVDFSSSCMDSDVAIKWSTASENNSMHFEVESSVDAFNWKVIAVVDAAQFSTSLIDYAILHEGAAREKNYYRLKQVDTDGAYEYYSIIYSDCGSDLDGAPIIFPNPSKNNFTIDFGGSGMKGIVQLTLVSMEGKEISNRQLNLGEGVSTFQINNLELQPGLYLIKMTDVTGKLFIIKHRFN